MAKVKLGSNAAFLGGNLGISIIGNHAYAFSGTFAASTSTQTMLQFTTGREYLIGEWFMSGGVSYASGNLGDGQDTGYRITINGSIVSLVKLSSITESMPTTATEPMVIPPYSNVQVEILSSGDSGTQLGTCSFVGRVYA